MLRADTFSTMKGHMRVVLLCRKEKPRMSMAFKPRKRAIISSTTFIMLFDDLVMSEKVG
jgi:hypothetical protein